MANNVQNVPLPNPILDFITVNDTHLKMGPTSFFDLALDFLDLQFTCILSNVIDFHAEVSRIHMCGKDLGVG